MSFTLVTNGTLLDKAFVNGIAGYSDRLDVQVSLDGACPSTNDAVRGSGSFEATLTGLRNLEASGLTKKISLHYVVTKYNAEDIEAAISLARQLGVAKIAFSVPMLFGRATTDKSNMLLDDDLFAEVQERISQASVDVDPLVVSNIGVTMSCPLSDSLQTMARIKIGSSRFLMGSIRRASTVNCANSDL